MLIVKIRRAHFELGHPIKRICPDLCVSRNTVRKIICSCATEFTHDRTIQPRPEIGPKRPEFDDAKRFRRRQMQLHQTSLKLATIFACSDYREEFFLCSMVKSVSRYTKL